MKPQISVIIPLHNSAKFLDTTIAAVLQQTFSDYELLLMENASSDNTYEIANSYSEKYPNIKSYKLDGKGICYARNCGLEKATGDFIVFLDHDDKISPDHLEALYECVSIQKCDLGIAPISSYYNEGKINSMPMQPVGLYENNNKVNLLGDHFVWAKIYKNKLIQDNNVRFQECVEAFEDWPFFVEMLLLSSKVYITDKSMYYYSLGVEGQASHGVTVERTKKKFQTFTIIHELLQKNGVYDVYKKRYEYELVADFLGRTFGLTPFKKLSSEQVREIIEPIKPLLLSIELDNIYSNTWHYKWFKRFKYFLSKDMYSKFFVFMRYYRNLVLQPLGIKVK